MKKCNFMNGFIFGAIAGVAIGILYAPFTGQETRSKLKQVKEDNEELIDKTKSAIEEGFDKLADMIDKNKKSKKS